MKFKPTQLVKILGCTSAVESKWIGPINAACEKYQINTILRLAAWIAQIGHESNRLSATRENLNYSAAGLLKTFPKYFDETTAKLYEKQPEKIANRVYANRYGNGNEASGDGFKFCGKGLVQVTFQSNYHQCSKAIGIDLLSNPDALTDPTHAAMSAGWFWNSKGLNAYADRKEFDKTTRIINGGTNGAADRNMLYERALKVLAEQDADLDKPDEKPADVPPATTDEISTDNTPNAETPTFREPNTYSSAVYPWNAVTESRSGHVTEVDDTPGNERLHTFHRTGSYRHIDAVGTTAFKSVMDKYDITKQDSYESVGGSYTGSFTGQAYYKYAGNAVFNSDATLYLQASQRVQINAPMLSVSQKINTPFLEVGQIVGTYANILGREATCAWRIGRSGGGGYSPAVGGSIGFSGDAFKSYMPTNMLSNRPRTDSLGNVLTYFGPALVPMVSTLEDPEAAAEENEIFKQEAAQGIPVFVKPVAFDKPISLSQTTLAAAPPPELFMNTLHTIINPSTGVGEVHISDGERWKKFGTDSEELDVILQPIRDSVTQETLARQQALLDEAQARSEAILVAIQAEVEQRNEAITTGLLAEAAARGAAITNEQTIRQAADVSLAEDITTLTASLGGTQAGLLEEIQARADGDLASATMISVLAARTTAAEAAIATESTARADGDESLAQTITTLSAQLGDDIDAAIYSEATARATEDGALSTRIDAVVATAGSNTAAIVTEAQARADGDSANSSLITSLTSTVAGNTATITSQQSSIDGLGASYGIKIDNNGHVSGFGLNSQPVNGVPVSAFNIVADRFSIVAPGFNGDAPFVPFSVNTSSTPPRVEINGLVSINGVNITPNSINADRLNVNTLSAVSANLGTVTAGKMQSTDGKFVIDLDNKFISITT